MSLLTTGSLSPYISSVGSEICARAGNKMDEIRTSYGSGGTTFSVTYDKLGGIIGTTAVPNSSIAGIREALLELYEAAFINGGSVPQGYNIENRRFIKEIPEFDARDERLEMININTNIRSYRSMGGLELTAIQPIMANTLNSFPCLWFCGWNA